MIDRENARAALARLDQLDRDILALRKPFDDEHAAKVAPMVRMAEGMEAERQKILELLGPDVEIVGHCEGCTGVLLTGDMGHRCADGPILCAACSPTYADALKHLQETSPEAFDDPEDHGTGLAHVHAFIAEGGDPATKLVFEL